MEAGVIGKIANIQQVDSTMEQVMMETLMTIGNTRQDFRHSIHIA
jgi:hypothetical protein